MKKEVLLRNILTFEEDIKVRNYSRETFGSLFECAFDIYERDLSQAQLHFTGILYGYCGISQSQLKRVLKMDQKILHNVGLKMAELDSIKEAHYLLPHNFGKVKQLYNSVMLVGEKSDHFLARQFINHGKTCRKPEKMTQIVMQLIEKFINTTDFEYERWFRPFWASSEEIEQEHKLIHKVKVFFEKLKRCLFFIRKNLSENYWLSGRNHEFWQGKFCRYFDAYSSRFIVQL